MSDDEIIELDFSLLLKHFQMITLFYILDKLSLRILIYKLGNPFLQTPLKLVSPLHEICFASNHMISNSQKRKENECDSCKFLLTNKMITQLDH